MPANRAPHKHGREAGCAGRDPGPEQRLRMCRLAFDGAAGLSVCALEIERGGVSYTVDTLRSLHASHPDAELTLIVGADVACTLDSWREPAQVLELADLAVAERPGAARKPVLDVLAGLGGDVRFLQMPAVDVSSSMARQRVADGEPIDDLVGARVAAYIAEHGLYRARTEAVG